MKQANHPWKLTNTKMYWKLSKNKKNTNEKYNYNNSGSNYQQSVTILTIY